MKVISAIILLFFAIIIGMAVYDAPERVTAFGATTQTPPETSPSPVLQKRPMTVAEKKKRFVEKTLPAIINVKAELDRQYSHVLQLSKKERLSATEQSIIDNLKRQYKVKGIPCLLNRLKTHPVSLVLAQAALETGWGTSRFYNDANNIFGIWSYNKKEPRIAADETRGAKTIYVKKYASLEDSIEGYYKMMATGHAYADFREARLFEENPFKLIRHLTHYSELREEYVKRLYHVMKSNRFYQYDNPSFKPLALTQIIPEYVKRQKAMKEAAMLKKAETNATPSTPLRPERMETDPIPSDVDCNKSAGTAQAINDANLTING